MIHLNSSCEFEKAAARATISSLERAHARQSLKIRNLQKELDRLVGLLTDPHPYDPLDLEKRRAIRDARIALAYTNPEETT